MKWLEGHPAEKGYYGVMTETVTPKGNHLKRATGALWDGTRWNVPSVTKYLPPKFETRMDAERFAQDFENGK